MKSSPLLYVLEILRHYAPLDDMLEVKAEKSICPMVTKNICMLRTNVQKRYKD